MNTTTSNSTTNHRLLVTAHLPPANLQLAHLRLHFKALTELRLPAYPGSALRGGFGHAFRKVVCTMGPIPCDTCILRTACPYYQLFEAPVPTNAPPLLQKTGRVPHAFIIEPDTDGKRHLQAGETFAAGLTMLGPAIRSLPYFLMAFQLFGHAGIGRAKAQFALAAAEAMSSEGAFAPYFDGDTGLAPGFPPVLHLNTSDFSPANLPLADLQTFQSNDPQGVGTTSLPTADLQTDNLSNRQTGKPSNGQTVEPANGQTGQPAAIQIHLQTPLRLKSRGDLVTRLTPREFFYHLCQRLSNLLFL